MFAIIGILLVFGAVIGGFLMEKGPLAVLLQPAELLIIAGAALGTLLIANPLHILKQILGGVLGVFGKSRYGKQRYVSTLKMMFELLNKIRRAGMLSIEMDIEKPEESEIFKPYPDFIRDHHVRNLVCDTMRMAVTGGVDPFDLDQMMDLDMEVQHRCAHQPISALAPLPIRFPDSASSPRCSAWSSPWARWAVLRRPSATKSRPPWSAPSSAFCFATGWLGRSAPT